jgi:isopenicillin N synthase-like dioxygenase
MIRFTMILLPGLATWLLLAATSWNIICAADITPISETDAEKLIVCNDMIPVIDLEPWIARKDTSSESDKNEVIAKISQACQSVGFFMIKNHGLSSFVMDRAWNVSRSFFELPVNTKLGYKTTNEAEYPYGYEQTEQLVKGKKIDDVVADEQDTADLKETFAIGPDNDASGMPLRRWQELPDVPAFQEGLEDYYSHMETLANTLLRLFALALTQEEEVFVPRMDHHMSALRLVHYYPLETTTTTKQGQGNKIRAGAHTDYGALTILNAQTPGLEVLLYDDDSNTTDRWFPAPVVPGSLVINLGDLMQRWTNDKWVSTLHRVSMPFTDAMERRYSMAYFVNINGDSLVEPLDSCIDNNYKEEIWKKYPPILAKDHLMAKHLASMSNQNLKEEL